MEFKEFEFHILSVVDVVDVEKAGVVRKFLLYVDFEEELVV